MRTFILLLFGSGVLLALICGIALFIRNAKVESIRKQLKERGIKAEARVIGKKFEKTRRIIHVSGGLQNFDTFLLKLEFNAKARKQAGNSISFNDALKGENSVADLQSKFVEFSKEVGKDFYHTVENGDKVPILFLPENPEKLEVLENNKDFAPNYLFWFAVGCLIFSLVSLALFMQYYKTGTTF